MTIFQSKDCPNDSMEDTLLSQIFCSSSSSSGEWKSQSHERVNVSEAKIHYKPDYSSGSSEPKVDFEEYPVFTVDGILSPTECNQWITLCNQIGFQNLDETFPLNYRQSSRLMIFSQKVARILYDRIIPHFQPRDLDVVPIGFGRSGFWRPVRFNECLKIVKYEVGGMIIPHQDGPWVPFEDQASIYTVVFYLNEDFRGGKTMILPHGEVGKTDLAFSHRTKQITPKLGKIAVFDHRVVHASSKLLTGTKYILRAELIFQRVYSPERILSSEFGNSHAYLYSEQYQEARRLYDLSREYEQSGRKEEFVARYQEVLRLQCYASSEENHLAALRQICLSDGDALCWTLAVSWLTGGDIFSLSTVSKGLNQLLRSNELWRGLYVTKWGDSMLPISNSGPVKRAMTDLSLDWRSLYQLRIHFLKSFRSTLLYLGVDTIHYGTPETTRTWFKKRQGYYHDSLNDFEEMSFPLSSDLSTDTGIYQIGKIPSRFYDVMRSEMLAHSSPMHMNLPDYARFLPLPNRGINISEQEEPEPPVIQSNEEIQLEIDHKFFPRNGRSLILDSGEPVNWSVCAALIRLVIGLQSTHPILLLVNPSTFPVLPFVSEDDDENDLDIVNSNKLIQRYFEETIRAFSTVLCTPAIRIEHVAIATLASFNLTSGYVVWISNEHVYATSVRLGIVRGNVLIHDSRKTAERVVESNLVASDCCRKGLNWRLEGHWDLSAVTVRSGLGFHQDFETIPMILVQGCRCGPLFGEVSSYFNSPAFSQQMGSLEADGNQKTSEETEVHSHRNRPNKFHYLGEVDHFALLKGAYALSIHHEHRSKCIFNSFA